MGQMTAAVTTAGKTGKVLNHSRNVRKSQPSKPKMTRTSTIPPIIGFFTSESKRISGKYGKLYCKGTCSPLPRVRRRGDPRSLLAVKFDSPPPVHYLLRLARNFSISGLRPLKATKKQMSLTPVMPPTHLSSSTISHFPFGTLMPKSSDGNI